MRLKKYLIVAATFAWLIPLAVNAGGINNNTASSGGSGTVNSGSALSPAWYTTTGTSVGSNPNFSFQSNFYRANSTTGGFQIGTVNALNMTGTGNVAVGNALSSNTTGQYNIGVGNSSLATATSTSGQIAIGYQALNLSRTSATGNMAIGYGAGSIITTGSENTAIGYGAQAGDTSDRNTVIGSGAGVNTGNFGNNVIVGARAFSNGLVRNVVIGSSANSWTNDAVTIGASSNVGDDGVTIGSGAGGPSDGSASPDSVIIGYQAGKISAGTNNTVLGYQVGSTTLTTGTSNILIGTSSAVTTPAAGTTNYLNIGKLIIGDVSKGIINYVSANHPTLGSCGGSPSISAGATNKRATVTEGTIATGCVIIFASGGFSATPNCLVDSASGLQFSYVASATTLTITNIGALSGTSIVYDCAGETVTP